MKTTIAISAAALIAAAAQAQTSITVQAEQRAVYNHTAKKCAACGKRLKNPRAWVLPVGENKALYLHSACITPTSSVHASSASSP